jgi:hypothetical protein
MGLIEVIDFSHDGWSDLANSEERASWCCEKLEDSKILWFRHLLEVTDDDRRFLCDIRQQDSSGEKNISYDASTGTLRGYHGSYSDSSRLSGLLLAFPNRNRRILMKLLSPYALQLQPDLVSFRPTEEQGRALTTHSRNDLIHIDAFPNRPARDRRILRFFTNLNLSKPRVWATSQTFEQLANRMAFDAGLARYVRRAPGVLERARDVLASATRRSTINHSPYDRFMLRFHDYLKTNQSFQDTCPKECLEFPAGSSWIAFTDAVPHSVRTGRCALEQTFFLPVDSMLAPHKSPLRILEAMLGSSMV